MHALVTGGTGFVGRLLVRRLVERGDRVRVLARTSSDLSVLGPEVEVVQGDVTDRESVRQAVRKTDVVFHLAGIRRAARREVFSQVNAGGTQNVCDAVAAMETPARIVFAGSIAATGPAREGRPVHEDDPFRPFEAYGESKAEAERILHAHGPELPYTVARPPRILGPGDKENLVFFKLVAKGVRLVIGGPERPLSMVDVADVVRFLLVLAEHEAALGEAFFVSGEPALTLPRLQDIGAEALGQRLRTVYLPEAVLWSLATLADGATIVSGRRLPLNRKLARQLTAPAWTCSIEKAKSLLGFSPEVDVADAVRASALWYRAEGLI